MTSNGPSEAIIRRWLTAVSLRAAAGDVASRGTPVEAAAALIAADAASETALGILADLSGRAPNPRETHENLITLAGQTLETVGASIPAEILRAVRVAHNARNQLVHHGQEPGPRGVEEALRGVDGLLSVIADVSPKLGVLPPGGGIATAVASLVDAPPLADQLRAGDVALAESNVREVLKACSIGHQILLRRAVPPLVDDAREVRLRGVRGFPETGSVEAGVVALGKRFIPVERWLVSMALGTSPAAYARFVELVGSAVLTMDGQWHHYLPDDPVKVEDRTAPLPPMEDARWALGELSRLTLRLWEMRALAEGDESAAWAARRESTR